MKYILVDYSFVIPTEDDKLEYTLDLIKLGNPNVSLIIEDTPEELMKYARTRRGIPPFE